MLTDKDYEDIEKELTRAFLEVFDNNLTSLVFYGSYARREARPNSDLDVIVVVSDDLKDRFRVHTMIDKVEELLRPLMERLKGKGYTLMLSPYILTESQAKVFRSLYIDAVFDAKILYDRKDFMESILKKARKILKELGARRVRIGKKWVVVLKSEDYRQGDRVVLKL